MFTLPKDHQNKRTFFQFFLLTQCCLKALNKTNDKLVLPVVQHDGFPEDAEDAYKNKEKIQLYTPQRN